jgi:hypothetical protein
MVGFSKPMMMVIFSAAPIKTIQGSRPFDFYNLCSSGVRLMNSSLFIEGRRLFSKASKHHQ